MGVVHKAWQRRWNRVVAVKTMQVGSWATATERRRFRAEADIGGQMRHPGIVAIHEMKAFNEEPFFSMEFIDGPDLARKVGKSPLAAEEAGQIVLAIADAVSHMHEKGYLHCDLKPANILWDNSSHRPRLIDFGLARRLETAADPTPGSRSRPGNHTRPVGCDRAYPPVRSARTPSGPSMGSPSFMAPEQFSGDARPLDVGTDIYGLGGILYYLLTAKAPFNGSSLHEVILRVHQQTPMAPRRINHAVPEAIEAICLRCLEKDPRRRYASAGEVAQKLRAIAGTTRAAVANGPPHNRRNAGA